MEDEEDDSERESEMRVRAATGRRFVFGRLNGAKGKERDVVLTGRAVWANLWP